MKPSRNLTRPYLSLMNATLAQGFLGDYACLWVRDTRSARLSSLTEYHGIEDALNRKKGWRA